MQNKFFETKINYDGTQLSSLFAYRTFSLLGDSVVSFRGACSVPLEHMVDGEDRLAGAKICGDDMLHFIIEMFGTNLLTGVTIQRLFAAIAKDVLQSLTAKAAKLHREGDDLYLENKKLSISIATVSPTSTLVHFALNISNRGTPVATCALEEDFGVDSKLFAEKVMSVFCDEYHSMVQATQKVFWVK